MCNFALFSCCPRKNYFYEIRNISISGFCIENIRNKRKAALSELERVFNVTIQDRP